jgi:hypothetical protein
VCGCAINGGIERPGRGGRTQRKGNVIFVEFN